MPPLNTHLVVGERVFPHLDAFGNDVYGDFLLGCLVVDVNAFSDIDRRVTHFVGRVHEDGAAAYTQSCHNFLTQLEGLLCRPWAQLTPSERAFVAGYLCHLAADEPGKKWGVDMMRALALDNWEQLPVPFGVMITAFSVMSHAAYQDFDAIQAALTAVTIPNVFTHVARADFVRMWEIVQPALPYNHTMDSYFMLLEGNGASAAKLQTERADHITYWEAALVLIEQFGGIQPFLDNAVARALDVLPRLTLDEEYP